MSEHAEADYVIIGAGSAGCAVAQRLSAASDASVLVLEAGGWDSRAELHRTDAASVMSVLGSDWSSEIDWGYTTESELHLTGRRVPVARGKVVGGCSSVNALMWVWGNRQDYDGWADVGNLGWSAAEVFPLLARSESFTGVSSAERGRRGPIQVRELDDPSPAAQAFVAATAELGFVRDGQDYNGGEHQDGYGFYYQTTRTSHNLRSSTADSYLKPALSQPNLKVELRAQATRLLLQNGRVAAVAWQQDGHTHLTRVNGEVVLAAGAFESPKLLMLSGIGAADELHAHGIKVEQDLPGVGQNLQDHLFVPVCFQSQVEHPVDALLSEAGLFTSTAADPLAVTPTLQFTFGCVKFLPQGAPPSAAPGPGITFAPIGLKPESRGRVQLRKDDWQVPAVVHGNYLSADRDVNVLAEGVRLAYDLANTAAFSGIAGKPITAGTEPTSDATALRDFVRSNATTLWHPVGTCRMGRDSLAVVDASLRVHGVDGLRVADASIMPEIVAGNTNAAAVMIGERCAELLIHSAYRTVTATRTVEVGLDANVPAKEAYFA